MIHQTWNDKTGRWEPQTNGDKIRAMSDEELAKRISERFCNGYGKPAWLDWLRQEAAE